MQKMTINSLADLVRVAAKLGGTGSAIHLILFHDHGVVFSWDAVIDSATANVSIDTIVQ